MQQLVDQHTATMKCYTHLIRRTSTGIVRNSTCFFCIISVSTSGALIDTLAGPLRTTLKYHSSPRFNKHGCTCTTAPLAGVPILGEIICTPPFVLVNP